jgi:hypothetical protein
MMTDRPDTQVSSSLARSANGSAAMATPASRAESPVIQCIFGHSVEVTRVKPYSALYRKL